MKEWMNFSFCYVGKVTVAASEKYAQSASLLKETLHNWILLTLLTTEKTILPVILQKKTVNNKFIWIIKILPLRELHCKNLKHCIFHTAPVPQIACFIPASRTVLLWLFLSLFAKICVLCLWL